MEKDKAAFRARNKGYDIGKIRSAPAQKVLDAIEAERQIRIRQREEKKEAPSNINAPQIQTDNSVHNTHMGRAKSTTNDPRMQNRRMAN